MTFQTATFDPKQFELRNYTNSYVTPEQSTNIALVESRVNGQLDFLAQMLGWNGPNYWTNLPATPDQKRQLLSGSFGVYESFVIPRILEIRNWNDTIVIEKIEFIDPSHPVNVEKVLLGYDEYQLQNLSVEGETFVISLGPLPQSFYTQIAANEQLKFVIPSVKPSPFFRPEVGVSGDSAFQVRASGSSLVLYPLYDTQGQFAYKSLSLFASSVYYFSQPVYIKFDLANPVPDIYPVFDNQVNLWYIKIPPTIVSSSTPITVFLCWDYSDSTTPTTVSSSVVIQNWVDCSDWNATDTFRYFTGAWGNKGGPLPFNLAFDSLSIHGVSEKNSLTMSPISRSFSYNALVESVYSQLTPYDVTAPGKPNNGDLWWNPATGALCVWYDPYNTGCATWVEVDYRQEPTEEVSATLVFPDVASFSAAIVPDNTIVLILDCNGLSTLNGILGLTGTITTSPSLYLFKEIGSPYWTPYQFTFATVLDFNTTQSILPFKVPCILSDSYGLLPNPASYTISNLDFQVLDNVPANLIKLYTNNNWELSPDSILRYISNSSLFGYENQGEMWWDYANSVYSARAASIYIQNAWVSVNAHSLSASPSYFLDVNTLRFTVDGVLLTIGLDYSTANFIISYMYNNATENYEFTYTPLTLGGMTDLPKVAVSDSLQGTYSQDITNLIFGGITYGLTPNVSDAETPLRLWKTEDLQGVGKISRLAENNFINPLLADINNGPNLPNWEKYFIRLPLNYGRNETVWQKVSLICQNFGYWGTSIMAEKMRCPPESNLPVVYEELFLYDQPIRDYTYVYTEPYLYSNIAYFNSSESADFLNSGFYPANDLPFDGYSEGELVSYDPLHNRLVNVKDPVGKGYGNWEGTYVNVNACKGLTGFFVNDLLNESLEPVAAPVWDASIYKIPPTCQNPPSSYNVDSNHYKIGYAYFVSDASAAEDGFFDPQQDSALRYTQEVSPSFPQQVEPKTLYMLPPRVK
jgi:hypothetical protein